MKYHKMVNNNREDIAVKCRTSDIEFRGRHPYSFEYLDSLSSYIGDYTRFLQQLTLKVPENMKYRKGTRYNRSEIVIHNSQVFVSIAEAGTTNEPFPYSKDWIALTDSYGSKCVSIIKWTAGSVDGDLFEQDNYGNIGLQEMGDILLNRKYYDYFNDGDYMILIDRNNYKYTMRMNFREYVSDAGSTTVSVDFVSDELIPNILFNTNATFGIENDEVKYIDNFTNVSIEGFTTVPSKLDTYLYSDIPNFLVGLLKNKYGYYAGYDRSRRISNDGVYNHNRDHMNGLYTPSSLGFNAHFTLEKLLWLPTATEVFGAVPFRRPDKYAFNVESGFRQLPSLNTAYKRVKTLNGKPRQWMTYTIESGTKYPCVVAEDGTRIPMGLANSNNNIDGNDIYVPLCFTMGNVKL
jgi:hypothetical protein